jgi:hypothetical protein
MTIDELAQMVAKGFEQTATKDDIAQIRAEMATKDDLKELEQRMEANFRDVRRDLDDLKKDRVSRIEFDDLMARMKLVETKLEIVSGKSGATHEGSWTSL